jgi:hypothetical protein
MNRQNQWLFEAPFYIAPDREYYSEPLFGNPIPLKFAPIHPDILKAKKGLYKIFKGIALIYNGQSGNLSQRLKSHRECLTSHKIDIQDYNVRIAPLPRSTEQSRQIREQWQRDRHPIALKHQRKTV